MELEAVASVVEEMRDVASTSHDSKKDVKKKGSGRFTKTIKAMMSRNKKIKISTDAQEEQDDETRIVGLTSLKSIIGHTKAAAGVGAFIKAAIAVNRRVVPPTAGCQDPNPMYGSDLGRSLYPVLRGHLRPPTSALKAGVSAMGFGGINAHVVVESGDLPIQRLTPAVCEEALLASAQDGELFVFGADCRASLVAHLQTLRPIVAECAIGDLCDLSASLLAKLPLNPVVRAAIMAGSPASLVEKIDQVLAAPHDAAFDGPQVWLQDCRASSHVRVAFLCPGQGSENLDMARWIIERVPALAERARQLAHISASYNGGPDIMTGKLVVVADQPYPTTYTH